VYHHPKPPKRSCLRSLRIYFVDQILIVMPNISLVLTFARWWGSSRAVQSQTLLVLLVIVDTDKGEQRASPCSCHCERNQRVSEIKYSDKKTQVSIYFVLISVSIRRAARNAPESFVTSTLKALFPIIFSFLVLNKICA